MTEDMLDAAFDNIIVEYVPIILGGTLLLIAAWIFGYWIEKLTKTLLQKRLNFNSSTALVLARIARYSIIVITVIAVLQELGVEISSLIAALSITGFAIAIGLRTTTNNFFNGIMLYTIKPYVVGDYVDGERVEGIVESINMFHTVVITKEGIYVAVPNGAMWAKSVQNFSRSRPNCVEIDIAVDHQVTFQELQSIITVTLLAEPKVNNKFKPLTVIKSVGNNSLNIRVSFWCSAEEERDVRLKISEMLREKLTAAGTVVRSINLASKKKAKPKAEQPASPSTDNIV